MPIAAYCEFFDADGNLIEGSVQKTGREGFCEIMEFEHSVRIPFDSQRGQLTGVRNHKPAQLTKEYDKASPILYDCLCNGKTIALNIHWFKIDDTGTEVEYFTHTLEGGKIQDIRSYMPNTKDPQKETFTHMEVVSVMYNTIEWLFTDGNIAYKDSWQTQT
jgi:type VI secretion system secreted protein Hcp